MRPPIWGAAKQMVRTARVVAAAMAAEVKSLFYAAIDHAAAVFEEAASHKPPSSDTWTDGSALTPKVPAPLDVSPPNAQTHRLPNEIESATLSPVRKNPCKVSQVWNAGIKFFETAVSWGFSWVQKRDGCQFRGLRRG